MAPKKNRKRAYIPPAHEVMNRKERSVVDRGSSRSRTGGDARAARVAAAQPEPSIRRTLRRLPIYFALIFLLQYYLIGMEQEGTTRDRLLDAGGSAALVTIAFAPFMHIMDRWSYNRLQRRAGVTPSPRRPASSGSDEE